MADESPTPAPDMVIPPAPKPPEVKGLHVQGADLKPWESPNVGRPPKATGVRQQITHALIIDFMLTNPRATQQQIAEAFGYKSAVSISVIVNSDAFQAALAKRQEIIVDPIVTASLEDRIRGLAARSAENLAELVEKHPDDFKRNLEVFQATTKAGQYGAKAQVAVQQQFVVALPGPAASSSEWRERFAPQGAVLRPRVDEAPTEVTPKGE